MDSIYIAHINEVSGKVQTIKEHNENVASLCHEYVIPEMKNMGYTVGLGHDIGKYQESFGRRIRGENIRVEHSICGALAVKERYAVSAPLTLASLMMQFCIAGHHSGLPDGGFQNDTSDKSTLCGRMNRSFEDFSAYKKELRFPDINGMKWLRFLMQDCGSNMDQLIDKFAFLTRYLFSCLVDADSKDTADFCNVGEIPRTLKANFKACLLKVDSLLNSFVCTTRLQETRSLLQNQAFEKMQEQAEIYLLNMPTGSGKTLASVKIALERAVMSGKKRIIYIIPYNSIIDQTAEVFENLFQGDLEILRHQSTFSYEDQEDESEDYRVAAKVAAENWGAPFIITTAVQFFESIYSNKRGKLRKLHNMSDSILVFDEAHLMPRNYLQPCLQAVSYITRYLNSEAIFLTATMPDFSKLIKEYALPNSRVSNLIDDKSSFEVFQKCRYTYLGELDSAEILTKSWQYPSSLIIVNKKATAKELYQECGGKKYHLSTYMTAYDRKRVLKEIREELQRLEREYPDYQNIPDERKITIISTSLIEAGVDLDVYTVFRETSGLDSVLQAGGRCNREGKRTNADVFVFDFSDETRRTSADQRGNLTKGLLKKYEDISAPKCIEEYFDRIFLMTKEEIKKNTIHQMCSDIESIPFKTYAEKFELIDSRTISLVVPRDEKSRKMVETLRITKTGNARQFQNYTCTLYEKELDDLIRQHVTDDFGTGIYCLTNPDYYDDNTGISFEAKDYII